MKFRYWIAACVLGVSGSSLSSCLDEFGDLNAAQGDIANPDPNQLFTGCLQQFEPMDYSAWFYDMPRMGMWSQCIVTISGNTDSMNKITEQGSVGSHVYDFLKMANDLRYRISQLSAEEKAKYEYLQYLCNPLQVFLSINDSDMYGSMQYSEADKGRYEDIFYAKFDTQDELVDIWLNELDAAINFLVSYQGVNEVGKQDIIYQGDLTKWAKFANSLKLKIAARLVNHDRPRAIQIVKDVLASPAGVMSSIEDDLVYNRGRYDNHWNNDFTEGAAHDVLLNFMKNNRDTRLLSVFTKNEFNAPVMQAFLDQNKGKDIPPYIKEQANFSADGKTFLGWKTEAEGGVGEPWVRYYGAPLKLDAGNDPNYAYVFDPNGTLLQLKTSAGGNRNYRPISYRNQEIVKGIYNFTYPDAPDATPDTDVQTTPWYGIYFSAAETQLLLAEFKLLDASIPGSAQTYLTEGCRLSAKMYDRAAELNQVPYYSKVCVNDKGDKTIKVTDEMIDAMLTHDAFQLNGTPAENLEKVYIQQYIHYIMNPIDQFVNVRRSGVPMKNSSVLAWQDFGGVISEDVIPRRFKVSEPADTDQLKELKIAAWKAQGFSYGTTAADPEVLHNERVALDKENPDFGEGPKL